MDEPNPYARHALAVVCNDDDDFALAPGCADKAIELNPNASLGHLVRGITLLFGGATTRPVESDLITAPMATGSESLATALIQPRMAGSTDRKGLRTRTSPLTGSGTGASTISKFSAWGMTEGRLSDSTRRFVAVMQRTSCKVNRSMSFRP